MPTLGNGRKFFYIVLANELCATLLSINKTKKIEESDGPSNTPRSTIHLANRLLHLIKSSLAFEDRVIVRDPNTSRSAMLTAAGIDHLDPVLDSSP